MFLPEEFKERIRTQLNDDAEGFFKSYDLPAYKGLRINPLKKDVNLTSLNPSMLPFHLSPISWAENGYYYEASDEPGKHPYHEAGMYYIQEPSAMAPVPLLEIKEGDVILDLCASPGGKSTQIASYMNGKGILVSNEINPQRAKNLSENIERMGIKNAIVTNESSGKLAERFYEFFDKILVDAPCSGEGMFRKNPEAIDEWSADNVKLCAQRQDEILDNAYSMLKTGGRLVYSTCTFAPLEDEECMERFISRHSDMILLKSHRIWPHIDKGEGHFLSVLTKGPQKDTQDASSLGNNRLVSDKDLGDYYSFLNDTFKNPDEYKGQITAFGDQLYLLPKNCPALSGLKVLRPGLHLGTIKKNRFEPSHALALSGNLSICKNVLNLDSTSREVALFLSGQSFNHDGNKGWYIITVDGFSIGWGKCAGGIMKNHYPKGLRKN
ncbi:MAG: RsmF rRNA methyltransferase first C-terminal domain-containing protein [Lachnospiraceae bacterium]|nr:RsmF rRNA methyltransferase first C-terminal domain-containing protein [Lachnospiraceae bacterium]